MRIGGRPERTGGRSPTGLSELPLTPAFRGVCLVIAVDRVCRRISEPRDSSHAGPSPNRSPDEALHEVPSERLSRRRGRQGVDQRRHRLPHRDAIRACRRRKRRLAERRRPDPLADIFEAEVVPLLKAAPGLRAGRRLRGDGAAPPRPRRPASAAPWSGASAPGVRCMAQDQEVIFRQVHEPGRMGLSDFTDMGDARHLDRRRRRSITGSTISGWPIPASSTPMSCSAARATWLWPKGCRTPCGRSAARRASTAPTACRRRSAISTEDARDDLTAPLRGAVRALRHDADPQQHRRRARERRHREPSRSSQARHR